MPIVKPLMFQLHIQKILLAILNIIMMIDLWFYISTKTKCLLNFRNYSKYFISPNSIQYEANNFVSIAFFSRSQKTSNAVYRMQHKIVTSLEWRCCPGYIGPNCQLKGTCQLYRHNNRF
jgi:hypothetical protein